MMLCRPLSSVLAAALAWSAPALAADVAPGWVVGKSDDSPVTLSRTLEAVTIEYRYVPDDYDTLKLTVDPCGDGPWYIKDSMDPQGASAAERGKFVATTIAEDLHNARLNCTLPAGVEDRLQAGFAQAWAQFEVAKARVAR